GGGLTPSDVLPAVVTQQQISRLRREGEPADILPLTPLQTGLLFHRRSEGTDPAELYTVQLGVEITGPLDVPRLREAVHTVVGRHPHLAARFVLDGLADPVQIVPRDPSVPWRVVDAGDGGHPGYGGDGRRGGEGAWPELYDAELLACGRLEDATPFRALLVAAGPERHELVLSLHHIVVDGWSIQVLLREIFAVYRREPLPPAPAFRA
ncbi:condensation domain-containing protein, partial [Streptomyces cacaoi]|uniref:condensation domain-containing protein n=2 Tax=Streptomyces TaxID=1883 RepID=UPI001302D7BE